MTERTILSPATGMVWKTTVEVGQSLEADDVVLLLESMKMEVPVTMPRAGRVVRWLVAEGESVAEDQPLAEIE
jgi:biotin carboxyl carrier protein